ncbi:MAG TPA: CapA family protein, partial [Methylomirabilota bacterium]|nr:CapA family protein [Methylomirabilota bacterium]
MPAIAIAGDVYPGKRSTPHLKAGAVETVFDGLLEPLRECHLRLANLEGPLVRTPSPIEKVGPLHIIDGDCLTGLAAAGFQVLNLGNNHAMDHGAAGLRYTLERCREQGVAWVGAGENLAAAARVLVREVGGLRVGFYSCTEHEFGIATTTEWGTNPLDVIQFARMVRAHRHEWDYLVVLLHGGNEYYPYPRPALRRVCQFMIEQGANAVVCQHSHCAGCWEEHEGGFIVHGQGNFLFDERSARPCEQEGFLVVLDVEGPQRHRLRLVPFAQVADRPGPVRMSAAAEAAFRRELDERSAAIRQPGFVEEKWAEFSRGNADRYLSLLHGYGRR